MKRVFVGLLGLTLAGCQQTVVTPEPLPELREGALGQTLTLGGQVADWPAGLTANIVLERYATPQRVIGALTGAGAFSVSTTARPDTLHGAAKALLAPIPVAVRVDRCSSDDLTVSAPEARGYGIRTLALTRVGGGQQALWPQLSPLPPVPELARRDAQQLVTLFYVDRDLRLKGTQVCSGKQIYGGSRWQQATSINVQLRAGWNIVTVKTEYLGPSDGPTPEVYPYRMTVQGGDMVAGTAWRYNGVALDR